MNKTVLILFLLSIFSACKSSENHHSERDSTLIRADSVSGNAEHVIVGAERLLDYLPKLEGQRVALVVNQTSVIGQTHIVDSLKKIGVNVVKVFAPEHGFRGNHSAGALVENGIDKKTGIPIVSLYGKNKKPNASMLSDVDVVVFDIQDVGVRFYTYISTMHYVMEACAENSKKVIILDRPNPNGFYIDGPVLDPKFKSFIGMHPIPVVHGLTVGELAGMINGEQWLKNKIACDVEIISCLNYDHGVLYELPIWPSPNLPNMNAVYLYPYLGFFEGTNVSIGRGTDRPFQIIGRPGADGELKFTPKSIPGVSDNPKHKGVLCVGETILDVQDSSLFTNPTLNLTYLIKYYKSNKKDNGVYFKNFITKLAGNEDLRRKIELGLSDAEIRETWQTELDKYKEMRKKYLLYP